MGGRRTKKVESFVVLSVWTSNFDTFQTVVNRTVPFLQLQSDIRAVREQERIATLKISNVKSRLSSSFPTVFGDRISVVAFSFLELAGTEG